MYEEAILNVTLWRKLYEKYPEGLPKEPAFWVILRNITAVSAEEAKESENDIKQWYLQDISWLPTKEQTELNNENSYNREDTNIKNMQRAESISVDMIPIGYGDIRAILPKENTKDAWTKLKAIVDAYVSVMPDDTKSPEG